MSEQNINTGNHGISVETDSPNSVNQGSNSSDVDTNSIISEIRLSEKRLSSKIETFSSNSTLSEEIKKINKEKESFIQQLNDQKDKTRILEEDKIKLDRELAGTKESKDNADATARKYADKLLFADFLENYAKVASDYFALLKMTSEKAYELFKKLSSSNEKKRFCTQPAA